MSMKRAVSIGTTSLLALASTVGMSGVAHATSAKESAEHLTTRTQVSRPNPVRLNLEPNDESVGYHITTTDGRFEIRPDGTPILLDAQGQVTGVFKIGKQSLPSGYTADLTYQLASSHELVLRAHVLNKYDRSCIGDALLFGSAVIGSIIAAPETLGGSVVAGLAVAGSEWNALDSCFGHH